jgi:hypothetical protein
MSGPWEKYQSNTDTEAGPWAKYTPANQPQAAGLTQPAITAKPESNKPSLVDRGFDALLGGVGFVRDVLTDGALVPGSTPTRATKSGSVLENLPPDPSKFDFVKASAARRKLDDMKPAAPVHEVREYIPPEKRSVPRAVGDTLLSLHQGGIGMLKGVTDNVNAGDNPVSEFFDRSIGAAERLKSADLRNQIADRNARIYIAGKNAGEVGASRVAFNTLFDNPGAGMDTVARGAGSLMPTLAMGAAGLGARGMGAVNAAANAGDAASQSADLLRSIAPEQWANDPTYQFLRSQNLSHEDAVSALAVAYSVPAQAVGGATGYLSGSTGVERVLAGGVKRGLSNRLASGAVELGGEQLETLAPMAVGNLVAGGVDGNTTATQGFGQAAVDTLAGSLPGAGIAAAAAGQAPAPAKTPTLQDYQEAASRVFGRAPVQPGSQPTPQPQPAPQPTPPKADFAPPTDTNALAERIVAAISKTQKPLTDAEVFGDAPTNSQKVDTLPERVQKTPEIEQVTPPAQPGQPGEGAGASQPTQAAPKFDGKGLKPGTAEYNEAFQKWSDEQQNNRSAKEGNRQREENKAAVEERNGWRAKVRGWFLGAKDGDTISDTGTEVTYKVVERTRKDGTKIKTLVAVDDNGNPLPDGRGATGISQVGERIEGLDNGWIDEDSGAALPETSSQSLATSLGKMLEDGDAKTSSASQPTQVAPINEGTNPVNNGGIQNTQIAQGQSEPQLTKEANPNERYGINSTPFSEGGKPFRTKLAASKAKKLQPTMRVVKVEGGYALADKTPKQLAADAQKAKRLSRFNSGTPGKPLSAHEFIVSRGGLSASARADLGVEGNPRVGNRTLYGSQGMTIGRATEMLREAGYIQEDSENAALDLIRRSVLDKPQYTAEGWEQMAQAEQDAAFEDYLAAQQEVAQDPEYDPFADLVDLGYDEQDIADSKYVAADKALQNEVNALMAHLDAMGFEPYDILEPIHYAYQNATQDEFNAAAKQALTEAITKTTQQGSDGDRSADNAEPSQPRSEAEAGQQAEAEGLTSYTPEEITQRLERLEQAEAERKAADAKAEQQDTRDRERREIARRSEAAADTFELGQDPMQNLSGQEDIFGGTGGLVNEPEASYNKPYETDLFGQPVPAPIGKPARAKRASAAGDGDLQPAAEVLGDTEAPNADYFVRTVIGKLYDRQLGSERILTASEAAKATAYLYRSAVERFDAIVTDKDGKPLAIVGGFKGAISQTSVYPATVMGEAVRIPGAAKIWFSHNHPSGVAVLSRADTQLNSTLTKVFRGSGIEPMGLLAVTGDRFAFVSPNGATSDGNAMPQPEKGVTVPVLEREQLPNKADRPSVSSPDEAKALAKKFYQPSQSPGLLLLDAQNVVTAWMPLPENMRGYLRDTGAMNAIYRAVSESNSAAVVIVHGGELSAEVSGRVSSSQNIAAALAAIDVRPLDSINVETGQSEAEMGLEVARGPVYDLTRIQQGNPLDRLPETPRVNTLNKLKALEKRLDDGKITQDEYRAGVQSLIEQIAKRNETQADRASEKGRERGPEWVTERLMRAKRKGELDAQVVDFALWALKKNPAMAEDLGISLPQDKGTGAAGTYNSAARIIRLFKGAANTTTGVHEILHHTERMMPVAVQNGILAEYRKRWDAAYAKADDKTKGLMRDMLAASAGDKQANDRMLAAFQNGGLDYDTHYQLVNASEFWAVNATDIMAKRYAAEGSWVAQAKRWLSELMQYLKNALGLPSDAPVLRALQSVLDGTGERVSPKMLFEAGETFNQPSEQQAADITETPQFKNWFGNSQVVDADGKPLVVYHGTNQSFDTFSPERGGVNAGNAAGKQGFYFTDRPDIAGRYSTLKQGDANIMPVFLSIQNPTRASFTNMMEADKFLAAGYEGDGAIIEVTTRTGAKSTVYAVKDPAQIKSATGNNGDFDPANPSILRDVQKPQLIEVDGKQRPTTNSDGDPIHPTAEGVRKFWRWFGDSKAVDAEGKPLVVYHGTNADITTFAPEKSADGVFHFSANTDMANRFAVSRASDGVRGANVMPVYLSIKNPKLVSFINTMEIQAAKSEGYDGLIADSRGHIVAFTPEQIKSATGNNGDFDPANPSILRDVPRRVKGLLTDENKFQAGARVLQDYFQRVKQLQDAIEKAGGNLSDANDVYQAETLSHGRKAEIMREFKESQFEPLMKGLAKDGLTPDELALFAYAKHAPSRNAVMAERNDPETFSGTEEERQALSGMSNNEARQILEAFKREGKYDKLTEAQKKLTGWTQQTRDMMRDYGLISPEKHASLDGMWDDYVPLRSEQQDEDAAPIAKSGKGFNVRAKMTMRAMGRETRAADIIENIVAEMERVVDLGERNNVSQTFLQLVLDNPDPSLYEIDVEKTRLSFDSATGKVKKGLVIDKGPDTVAVRVKGQDVYIKVKDDLLAKALRADNLEQTGKYSAMLVAPVTNMIRNTLTRYNPEFAVVNTLRDIGFGAAAMKDELGNKGMALFAKNYSNAMKVAGMFTLSRDAYNKLPAADRKMFDEYRAAGGMTGGFYKQDVERVRGDIRDLMLMNGATPQTRAEKAKAFGGKLGPYRLVKTGGRVLEYIGSVSESAARFAAYKSAIELGKTPQQAARIAKDLTTNFDRKGELGRPLNTYYIFFNAAVQGTERIYRMVKNPKMAPFFAGTVASFVALALMNAAVGGEDEEDGQAYWDKIPQHVKERNLIIMLPPGSEFDGAEKVGTTGRYITIPIQYGLNIFTNFGYQLADAARNMADKSKGVTPGKAAINTVAVGMDSVNPFGGSPDNEHALFMAAMPTIVDIPYQFFSGVDGFGRPIVPGSYKNDDAVLKSDQTLARQQGGIFHKAAKGVNALTGGNDAEKGLVDFYPGSYELLWRNLTGGTGKFITDTIGLVDAQLGDPAEKPDLTLRDVPFARKLGGVVDDANDLSLYYDRKREVDAAQAELKRWREIDGETSDPDVMRMQDLIGPGKRAQVRITAINRRMRETKADKDMTNAEKLEEITSLQKDRARAAKEFNEAYMQTLKEAAQAK